MVSTCMQGREVSTRCLHLDRGAAAISRNQSQSAAIRLHLDRGAHARRVDERKHVIEPAVFRSDEPPLGVFELNLAMRGN